MLEHDPPDAPRESVGERRPGRVLEERPAEADRFRECGRGIGLHRHDPGRRMPLLEPGRVAAHQASAAHGHHQCADRAGGAHRLADLDGHGALARPGQRIVVGVNESRPGLPLELVGHPFRVVERLPHDSKVDIVPAQFADLRLRSAARNENGHRLAPSALLRRPGDPQAVISRRCGDEARLVFGLAKKIGERAAHLERTGRLVGFELQKDRTVAPALRPNEPGGRKEGANELMSLLDECRGQSEPAAHHGCSTKADTSSRMTSPDSAPMTSRALSRRATRSRKESPAGISGPPTHSDTPPRRGMI